MNAVTDSGRQWISQWSDGIEFIGRLCLGAIFLWGGYGKAMAMAGTLAYFNKLGVPMPTQAYYLAVFVELVGGALLVLGLFYRPTAAVLGIWCIATAFLGHSDFGDRNMLINFYKNFAMFGGFMQAMVLGAGAYSVDAALRNRARKTEPAYRRN